MKRRRAKTINPAEITVHHLERKIAQWGDGTVSCWTGGTPIYVQEGEVLAICRTGGTCFRDEDEKDKALPPETPLYMRSCKPQRLTLSSAMIYDGFAIEIDQVSQDADLLNLERNARENKRGLWTSDCFLFGEKFPFPRE